MEGESNEEVDRVAPDHQGKKGVQCNHSPVVRTSTAERLQHKERRMKFWGKYFFDGDLGEVYIEEWKEWKERKEAGVIRNVQELERMEGRKEGKKKLKLIKLRPPTF